MPSFFFSSDSDTAFSFVLLKFSMGVAALQMTPKTNDIDAETVKNWRRKRFCVEIFSTDDGIYANDGDENVDYTIGDGFGGGGDDGFGDVFDDVISSLAPTADGLFDDGIADDLRLTMNQNKAGYTATSIAYWWAGAVIKKGQPCIWAGVANKKPP